MSLTVEQVGQIAQDVAERLDPRLRVLSASTAEGGSGYIEILVLDSTCDAEPCRFVVGADRTASEPTFRTTVEEHLRRKLADLGRD
jgi:hypothetical protein